MSSDSPGTEVTRAEPPATFLKLLDVHARLNEYFLQHQEALLALDLPLALQRLRVYRRELLAHMRPEEEILLPRYVVGGVRPGGPLELFLGEHRKMLEFLDRFEATLERLRSEPGDLRRAIIALFDEQAMFKHLVEHHDLRERNILYPALDRVTTEAERRELLRRCLDEHQP